MLPPLEMILANRLIYGREAPIQANYFILMVELVLLSVPTIYYLVIPPPIPSFSDYFFKKLSYFSLEHFNKSLSYFWRVHAVSHDVLSDNGLFRPMYIEEFLHRTESASLSVAKGVTEQSYS